MSRLQILIYRDVSLREIRTVEDAGPYNYYVLMPVVSTESGARAARATLTFAVYHLNVRV